MIKHFAYKSVSLRCNPVSEGLLTPKFLLSLWGLYHRATDFSFRGARHNGFAPFLFLKGDDMKNTSIAWTDHTLNFWWGCQKVSPGCQHCYAETFSKRVGKDIWGPAQITERWRTKNPWRDIFKWDKEAGNQGVRRKVFVQSMSDFFEDHSQVVPWRVEACQILESLKNLDVQLLTKRPENVLLMTPPAWLKNWPLHIWLGASAENQKYLDSRMLELCQIPAKNKFLSCEPLLTEINLSRWLSNVDWIIIGGESGAKARPFNLCWGISIIKQCYAAGIPAFMKQVGANPYIGENINGEKHLFAPTDRKGENPDEWPEVMRIREFPT
jgi:protein gp37